MIEHVCEYTKNHLIEHLKWVHCNVYKFCLNKDVKKTRTLYREGTSQFLLQAYITERDPQILFPWFQKREYNIH